MVRNGETLTPGPGEPSCMFLPGMVPDTTTE